MPDVFTKAKRSQVMAAIRSTGNRATEGKLIRIFRENGITGWSRSFPLPGKPDLVFPRERITGFVDGCFWHECPLYGRNPVNNQACWLPKLARNRARDTAVTRELKRRAAGECSASGSTTSAIPPKSSPAAAAHSPALL